MFPPEPPVAITIWPERRTAVKGAPLFGAAERTLRAACEEHLGMGPIRYLTFRRMHLVRRALVRADPATAKVTQIAMDHGFWELGRFSVAYRQLFGEAPSDSLRRPADDRRVSAYVAPGY